MKLDVIKNARFYVSLSSAVILAGLVAMVISFQQIGSPLRLGIDFTGGSSITLGLSCGSANNCGKKIDVGVVRQAIESKGFANSVIQSVEGKDLQGVSVRTARLSTEQREKLRSVLTDALKPYGEIDPKKSQIDEVGPAIGQQALNNGLLALAISFAGIGIYLTFRFQSDYASFAIIALFHDIFVTAGMFSTAGYRKNLKRTLLPALLFPTCSPIVILHGYLHVSTENPEVGLSQGVWVGFCLPNSTVEIISQILQPFFKKREFSAYA